ncbi:Type IV pilus biogenesis protein PilM [hydrothermal vent metagenome]|uniref:Type IV pilus biogenesis protein PilM n=1 Tax=hydrothermal vent metagenome TaxID=652676 RepID=A0A1W1DA69_9ZZZZ
MLKKVINLLMNYLSKFNVEQEDLLGLDITPGAIRVVQLSEKDNKWTVERLSYKYLDGDHTLASLEEDVDQYVDKIQQLVTANKIKTKNAAVSIPVSSAIIKVVSIPLMSDEELQEALDTKTLWDNTVQLADNLDEYSVFWQKLGENTKNNSMDLLFVASKLDEVDKYLNIVRKAGLNPVVIDVRCFAIRNALELRKDLKVKDSPIVIVEFGPYENYILILHDDAPFVSDIYLSEKDKAIFNSGSVDDEDLKRIIARLSMQISQMVSSYQSKYKTPNIENILLVSTVSNIDSMIPIFNNKLNSYKAEVFNAFKAIIIPENIKKKSSAEQNQSMFCSVLGLATRKLDVFGYYEYVTGATSNINLLPDRDGVKNQEKMKFLSRWAVVIFVIISFIVGIWSYLDGQAESEELAYKISEYETLMIQKEAKKIKLTSLKDQKTKLSGMLKASSSIVSNQKIMHAVLLGINSSVPQGVSLKSIEYQGDGQVVISGLSVSDQNILQFIENLAKSSAISKSSLLLMSVKKVKKRTLKLFTVLGILADQKTVNKKEVANGH